MVWETKILDYKAHHVKQGSAPLVANGVLIAGRNCQPNGGPDALHHHGPRRAHGQRALAQAHDP